MIYVSIASVLFLTGLVWLLTRRLPFRICPLCSGVSLTWMWMLVAKWLGADIDPTVPAVLMGGSVVGLYSKLEIKNLFWKSLFVAAGFAAVYGLLEGRWAVFAVALLALAGAGLATPPRASEPARPQAKTEELKKKMEQCC